MTSLRDDLVSDAVHTAPPAMEFYDQDVEYVLDKVLAALHSPQVRQQVVLEIDPLDHKMTYSTVDTVLDAIIAVLGKQGE